MYAPSYFDFARIRGGIAPPRAPRRRFRILARFRGFARARSSIHADRRACTRTGPKAQHFILQAARDPRRARRRFYASRASRCMMMMIATSSITLGETTTARSTTTTRRARDFVRCPSFLGTGLARERRRRARARRMLARARSLLSRSRTLAPHHVHDRRPRIRTRTATVSTVKRHPSHPSIQRVVTSRASSCDPRVARSHKRRALFWILALGMVNCSAPVVVTVGRRRARACIFEQGKGASSERLCTARSACWSASAFCIISISNGHRDGSFRLGDARACAYDTLLDKRPRSRGRVGDVAARDACPAAAKASKRTTRRREEHSLLVGVQDQILMMRASHPRRAPTSTCERRVTTARRTRFS